MSSLCLMLIKSNWLNSGLELATLRRRYREEREPAKRRTKNTMHSQTV